MPTNTKTKPVNKKQSKVAPKAQTKKVAKVDKPLPKQTGGNKNRFFKIFNCDSDECKGRFAGKKPKQAANKALTSILKDMENKEEDTTIAIPFSIIECTRGSKRKVYNYRGLKELLEEPMTVEIKGKAITYKYNNKVSKARPEEQEGGDKVDKKAKKGKKADKKVDKKADKKVEKKEADKKTDKKEKKEVKSDDNVDDKVEKKSTRKVETKKKTKSLSKASKSAKSNK